MSRTVRREHRKHKSERPRLAASSKQPNIIAALRRQEVLEDFFDEPYYLEQYAAHHQRF